MESSFLSSESDSEAGDKDILPDEPNGTLTSNRNGGNLCLQITDNRNNNNPYQP